jgi:ABC-type transporter Mla subunit MlaD
MTLADKAKQLAAKAQSYAAGHKDQIEQGIQKAERTLDAKTGGKYHDQLDKASHRADAYINNLPDPDPSPNTTQPPTAKPDNDTPDNPTP